MPHLGQQGLMMMMNDDLKLALGSEHTAPSEILDKICLCQILNLSNVGALRHSKIFVNHKCQSHGNKHRRLLAVCGKDYMTTSQESWAYGDLCCLSLLLLVFQFFLP